MKRFQKNYIGKGREVSTKSGQVLDIVKITLSVEEMMKFVHEYKEKEYITFEVATLRNEDQFGHTHTVYATTMEKTEDAPQKTNETPKPKRKRRTKAQIEADKIADKQEMESMQTQTDDSPF